MGTYLGKDLDKQFARALNVRIETHHFNPQFVTVDLRVHWHTKAGKPQETLFNEDFMQDHHPKLVYAYWAAQGGRCKTLGVDEYHIYEIHGEDRKNYLVQYVGYDRDEDRLEPKAKIREICPAAVRDWERDKGKTVAS